MKDTLVDILAIVAPLSVACLIFAQEERARTSSTSRSGVSGGSVAHGDRRV
jgi:hypothetical protein